MIVTGMQCGGCTTKLSVALYASEGVSDVQISLASGEVSVRYDQQLTTPTRLNGVVIRTGFRD
jgi:copper chaperone CopZ